MPHIIVEHSSNIASQVDVPTMLNDMHVALVGEGVDQSRIKTRAILIENSVVGNSKVNEGQMVHITLLLLEGRDDQTKKKYSISIHTVAKAVLQEKFPDCAVTLEVRDMVAKTYIL